MISAPENDALVPIEDDPQENDGPDTVDSSTPPLPTVIDSPSPEPDPEPEPSQPSVQDVAQGAVENPLALKIEKIFDEKAMKKSPYWIGTTQMRPLQNMTLGGHRFPHFSGVPSFDERGVSDRPLDLGQEVQLNDEEVAAILTDIKRKVYRRIGERAIVFNRGTKGYSLRNTDEPIAKYVYMIPGRRVGREVPPALFDGFQDES